MHSTIVKSWMTSPAITVKPHTTLLEALELMHQHCIRRLPVVGQDDQLVGMVTLGDLREAWPSATSSLAHELDQLLRVQPIMTIMSRHPITVTPETSLDEAARLMLEHKFGGLPVVQGGRVVGMLTECDIFRMVIREQSGAQAAPVAVAA